MVAFLKKLEGSAGFHQIVDFLNSTHIKYALTKNSTIYVSLIHQFWQTASASTSENGEMEITATIDGRVKTITEASIRRHLKLEDSDGISTLPNTKIFEQLALMGYVSNYDEGSTIQIESHHILTNAPSTSQLPTSPPSMQTTYVAEEPATMPHDSPLLRVYSLGSDEGNMTLYELMVLCTTLSKKVESLESDLKQTKLTYGAAYTKLIMKVVDVGAQEIKGGRFFSIDLKDVGNSSGHRWVNRLRVRLSAAGNERKDKNKTWNHEGSKRQKTNEEQSVKEEKELSEEELHKLMMIVPVEDCYVEKTLQLWSLVQERFISIDPTDDKERTLWVKLKRLFEPDIDDIMLKLQRYMHDPLTWRLYDTCGVHHVSTDKGYDIFILVEKDYPLSKGVLMLMLVNKLLVEQSSEMANELLKKIFILANKTRQ
ncbi:hypothetical protein Tco_1141298 [Tanacetum coccineum]